MSMAEIRFDDCGKVARERIEAIECKKSREIHHTTALLIVEEPRHGD